MRLLARFLDNAIPVPMTQYRVGFDALIGLIPGIGDAITFALASYIVFEAWRMGASKSTLAKMAGNIVLDLAVGLVPAVGDVLDVFFKASARNLALFEAEVAPGEVLRVNSRTYATTPVSPGSGTRAPDRPAPRKRVINTA
jgi:hypothetical protein